MDAWLRWLLFGVFGWCAEIVWTAAYDLVSATTPAPGGALERVPLTTSQRLRLEGRTYLWMLPIYATGGLLFEVCHRAVGGWPLPLRGLVYMVGAFALEAVSGQALKLATGRCPWDYSYSRWSALGGVIRLDYAPVWFGFGLLLEPVQRVIQAAATGILTAP